jgi:predicted TPR repeat methyltransferase
MQKEKEKEKDFILQSSGRIAHTYSYIRNIALLTNFTILEISKQVPRTDRGKQVKGYLVILKKIVT